MTPAQLQELCIEAEDIRREVQTAYRRGEMTDQDAADLLRMVRNIRLFMRSPTAISTTGNHHNEDPHSRDSLRLDWPG